MKNVTLVAGEGEGAARKTSIVGTASGLERRELFTDARDISSDVGEGKTLTSAEYTEQLNQRGTEKLSEYKTVTSFEGEVEATRMFKYGTDFLLAILYKSLMSTDMKGKHIFLSLSCLRVKAACLCTLRLKLYRREMISYE